MDRPVVSVQDLRKSYGTKVAVDGISFEVAAGESFGLVGPNGAGKTTTMEVIEGLRAPDSGTVRVLGRDPQRQRLSMYRDVGVQLQEGSLAKRIRVREALALFHSFYANPVDLAQLTESCGLGPIADSYYGTLSGGEKKRVLLALALVGRPDLVILDEPTSGMDPQARYNIWELLGELRRTGTTLVLTTHYLEEAQEECGRICLVDHGTVVASGPPRDLLAARGMAYCVRLPLVGAAPADHVAATLAAVPGVAEHDLVDGAVFVYGTNGDLSGALRSSPLAGIVDWNRLETRPARLEDLYLHTTGRAYRKG